MMSELEQEESYIKITHQLCINCSIDLVKFGYKPLIVNIHTNQRGWKGSEFF